MTSFFEDCFPNFALQTEHATEALKSQSSRQLEDFVSAHSTLLTQEVGAEYLDSCSSEDELCQTYAAVRLLEKNRGRPYVHNFLEQLGLKKESRIHYFFDMLWQGIKAYSQHPPDT